MTDFQIYAGEDFALLLSAVADDSDLPEEISGYEITAQLSTTNLGSRIIASTIEGRGIEVVRTGSSTMAINICHELTSKLTEGAMILTVMLIDKATGVQIIAETKTINVKRSKLQL